MDTPTEKSALRARFRAERLALSEATYASRSAAACERLLALPALREAATVHVYWPLVARRELDTRPFISALHAAGRTVVLPVVEALEGPPRLRHARYEGEGALAANAWGLHEPLGPAVPLGAIDAVVVPALGAGRNGHRIGHGRGFYDAFLAERLALNRPVTIVCVVFDACLVAHVPPEPHDVAVDLVVTERATVHP